MDNVFTTIARRETTLSELMENREKISMDEIIEQYPNYITVNGFDMINTNGDTFPVLTFIEDNTKFFFGGAIMANICSGWLEHFEGDIKNANEALKNSDGVRIRFKRSKTKSGNNITLPEIVTK